MKKISAVVSAYNEEKNIEICLKSLKWVDEIIVIDNESMDSTKEIAEKLGALVFSRPNNPMLNINKNFGFTKAEGEWIINLDADEIVTPELKDEIIGVINSNMRQTTNLPAEAIAKAGDQQQVYGYWIPRQNIIFGKWIKHSLWCPDNQLRLFKKGKGVFPQEHIHEYLKVEGETGTLKNPLMHNNYASVNQYINKINKLYAENEAETRIKKNEKIIWKDALEWPLRDFITTFFSLKGYKDGLHGLSLSILQAFYQEIVFLKIWEKQGFITEEIKPEDIIIIFKKLQKELEYWLISMKINETKNPLEKFILRIKRKLIIK